MGKQLDWSAIPLIFEYAGVEEPEAIIDALIHIKEIADKKAESDRAR